MKKILSLFAAVLLLAPSCKKSSSKTTCSSTVYGVNAIFHPFIGDTAGTYHFGIVNETSGTTSSLGTLISKASSEQGAFNTSDNCYYFPSGMSTLYKVSTSGSVVSLSYSGGASVYVGSIVYNRFNNKLYGFSTWGNDPSVPVLPQEISVSGSGFSFVGTVPIYTAGDTLHAGLTTVDNTTGFIYFVQSLGYSSVYTISKFIPGSTTSTPIATITDPPISLQFNKNDNMLYALTGGPTPAPYKLVKIDPSTGTATTLSTLPFTLNSDYISAVIDPCSNQFLISVLTDSSHSSYSRLSMSGAVLQHDTVSGVFQGLIVND